MASKVQRQSAKREFTNVLINSQSRVRTERLPDGLV